MTLLPLDSWNVNPAPGPRYKVGPRCCNPNCRKVAEHAHHMWRRSFLGGDHYWVVLPNGDVVGNVVAVCATCHDDLTGREGAGHKAAIRLGVNDSRFWWCSTAGQNGAVNYEPVDPIDPQPPARESLVASPAASEPETCPTCGQRQPVVRSSSTPPDGERRRRKNWTIPIPADSEEDGAWVLDTLVDDLAPYLGLHPNKQGKWTTARYYVLVPALYFAQQNREAFLKEVVG